MKIRLDQAYKPIEIEFGSPGEDGYAVVKGRIDLRDRVVDANLKELLAVQHKAQNLMIDYSKLGPDDQAEIDECYRRLSQLIAAPIKRSIGEKTYDEILTAMGGGEAVAPEEASIVMTQLFAEVLKAVNDHVERLKNNKAAHYLMEKSNAKPKPNRAARRAN